MRFLAYKDCRIDEAKRVLLALRTAVFLMICNNCVDINKKVFGDNDGILRFAIATFCILMLFSETFCCHSGKAWGVLYGRHFFCCYV